MKQIFSVAIVKLGGFFGMVHPRTVKTAGRPVSGLGTSRKASWQWF
jgi:hypothetical protein